MRHSRWLRSIKSLGLELWLPLPLLGVLFWVGGGLLTDYLLSRSYYNKDKLQVNTQIKKTKHVKCTRQFLH